MRTRIRTALLLTAFALSAVLAWQLLAPIAAVDVPPGALPPRHDVAAKIAAFVPPPESAFAVINARPAFSADRAPVEEPETAIQGDVASPPQVTLVGVAIGAGKSVALLKPYSGGAAISAVAGQIVDGWQLLRIEADRVVFRANGTDYAVKLRMATGLMPQPVRNNTQQQPGQPGQ